MELRRERVEAAFPLVKRNAAVLYNFQLQLNYWFYLCERVITVLGKQSFVQQKTFLWEK